jgi:hypothetical protein
MDPTDAYVVAGEFSTWDLVDRCMAGGEGGLDIEDLVGQATDGA